MPKVRPGDKLFQPFSEAFRTGFAGFPAKTDFKVRKRKLFHWRPLANLFMIDIFYHIFDIYAINALSFDLLRASLGDGID